jgi:glutaryl-CoA dehydrogenase
MITVAREQADGTFVLDGAKMWITNGSTAQVAIVWAKMVRHGETAVGDDKTIRGFIVPTDTPGFRARDQKGKLSLRASDTSELILEDVRLPADAILPGSGGLKSPLMCLTQARYGISWGALGAAIACFEEATSYAKTRVMFDRPSAASRSSRCAWPRCSPRSPRGSSCRCTSGGARTRARSRPRWSRWPSATT